MTDRIDLGPRLEPPRGGLSRLQQSVRRPQVPGHGRTVRLAAVAVAGLAAIVVLVAGRNMIQRQRFQLAVRDAVAVAEETRFENAAYQILPSHGRNVRIILIGTLPPRVSCGRTRTDRTGTKAPLCSPVPG